MKTTEATPGSVSQWSWACSHTTAAASNGPVLISYTVFTHFSHAQSPAEGSPCLCSALQGFSPGNGRKGWGEIKTESSISVSSQKDRVFHKRHRVGYAERWQKKQRTKGRGGPVCRKTMRSPVLLHPGLSAEEKAKQNKGRDSMLE